MLFLCVLQWGVRREARQRERERENKKETKEQETCREVDSYRDRDRGKEGTERERGSK